MRPETRACVQAAARELAYQPDVIARSLRRGRTTTVGVIVADLGNFFLPPILRGIAEVLEQKGFMPVITETLDDHDRLRAAVGNLLSRKVDALIVSGALLADARLLQQVSDSGIPVVLAVRPLRSTTLISVTTDDVAGGMLAARHLADFGHERVVEFAGPGDAQPFLDRSVGFSEVAEEVELDVVPAPDTATHPVVSEGQRLMELLLGESGEPPTAVFAHNDAMAIGAIDALRARKLRCPEDVSVLGYNDSPLVDHFNPPLSTIRLPSAEIGRFAAEVAIDLIEDPDKAVVSMTFPPTLISRGSVMRRS